VKVVLASANPRKLEELSDLLSPLGLELVGQSELGIQGAPETAPTFVENALLKARHACRQSGLAAIADDSGIAADALGGAPGVYSARYAGENATDDANNEKLLRDLAACDDKSAHYYCVIAFIRHPEDPAPLIATGRWDGRIIAEPSGTNGFGYDPHFYLIGPGQTAAELSPALKNQLSHRGQAVRQLTELLGAQQRLSPSSPA
jgi:XTP/dITP diphosphohydrolase